MNRLRSHPRNPSICFALALLSLANGAPALSAQPWVAKRWTSPNAPAGPLTDLALAPDGFLLVASGEGLRRFDGIAFSDRPGLHPASHPNWQTTAVFVSRQGDLWIGYRGEGIELRQGANSLWFGTPEHESLRFVRCFWEDPGGLIWIGSDAGLTLAREGKLFPQPQPPGRAVYRIKGSPENRPRVATDLGLFEFRDQEYVPIAIMPAIDDMRVRDFELEGDGTLWVATMGGVFRLRDGEKKVFRKQDGLAGDWVRRLVFDPLGRLWAAGQGGVSCWTGEKFESLDEKVLEKRHEVTALVPGEGGELWIATSSGDLARLQQSSFSLIENTHDPGNSHLLSAAEDSSGHLWLGWNYFGLIEQTALGPNMIRHIEDRPLNRPIALFPARAGGVWCTGSDARLFRAAQGNLYFENIPGWGNSTPMSTVLEDRRGRLWVGSFEQGLACKTDGQWRFFDLSSGLRGRRVLALHEDAAGTIWVGADQLYQLVDEQFVPLPEPGESPLGEITCLQSDAAGNLWVGTHGNGLFRNQGERWSQYGRQHGLIEEIIHGLVLEEEKRLWLQGPQGVTRLQLSQLKEWEEGMRSEISADYWPLAEQGVNTGTGTRHPTCFRLRNEQVLFVTTGGAAVFNPDAEGRSPGRTTVRLEKLLVDGQAMPLDSVLRIAPGARRVAVHWAAVNLSHPESLRFRHRLAGLDETWLEDGSLREAHYGSLPAGNYRFELQVRDIGTAWRAAVSPLPFQQLPRWHERWSMRWLMVAAFVFLWWAAHRARVRHLENRFRLIEAERHRIAGELHDTVEQGLAGIAINLDAASRQLRRTPSQAEEFLASARRLLIRSRDEARQAIWEMRSARFRTGLIGHLEHAVRDVVAGTGMSWSVTLEGALPNLPEEVTRRILRLVLEAVTNAAKHSQGRRLTVSLQGAPDRLLIRIVDDGRGFEPESASKAMHYGLDLMRSRAVQLGGQLEIASAPGQGARVVLLLPLPITLRTRGSLPTAKNHRSSHVAP